ncbi:hypothetical protein Dsin_014844 [Dipteronia sinensis]|uniref:BHLH domain-containing protein n=1 Tax=Dipteronia sinensis TaxID=43782 RepID=A0AAE0ANU6_9ROSI|nr:hypothetical protein Dsin_014844 [Dipteronia sinensis]
MDRAGNNLNKIDRKSQWRRKLSVSDMSEEKNTSIEDIKKKMTHKDTEKQRRQEMSTLHASLRSLLPLEYIKGKRSMSDHMNGAVYYINDLKNKIKELNDKRDELIKRVSNSSASSSQRESAGGSRKDHDQPAPCNCVMIHPCLDGLEIVISSTSFMREQGFLLSMVLEILIKEGLDVVSCLSTEVNEKLLLTIHTKVSDLTYIDLSGLHQKLTEVMISTSTPSHH